MADIHCEIITAERVAFKGDVDMVVAPGIDGQMGILPHHAPLMTALSIGELVLHKAGEEDTIMAIGGGFMEVGPEHVTVLADSAERAEEIDETRAEAARRRAEATMAQARGEQEDFIRAETALRRSVLRLKVAKRKPGSRPRSGSPKIGQ
jgi:F-type H+-transporting ATPase subunit epsilon